MRSATLRCRRGWGLQQPSCLHSNSGSRAAILCGGVSGPRRMHAARAGRLCGQPRWWGGEAGGPDRARVFKPNPNQQGLQVGSGRLSQRRQAGGGVARCPALVCFPALTRCVTGSALRYNTMQILYCACTGCSRSVHAQGPYVALCVLSYMRVLYMSNIRTWPRAQLVRLGHAGTAELDVWCLTARHRSAFVVQEAGDLRLRLEGTVALRPCLYTFFSAFVKHRKVEATCQIREMHVLPDCVLVIAEYNADDPVPGAV